MPANSLRSCGACECRTLAPGCRGFVPGLGVTAREGDRGLLAGSPAPRVPSRFHANPAAHAMDYQLAETLRMLIGMGALTVVLVTGLKVWIRKKELDAGGSGRLDEALEAVRDEIDELRAEQSQQVADLQERIDFTERLLARGKDST